MDKPEFLEILEEAIPENFKGMKWKKSWSTALLKFYTEQRAKGIPEEVFTIVAEQLGASAKEYINYALAYRQWFRNHLKWNPLPVARFKPRVVTDEEVDNLRKAWGE